MSSSFLAQFYDPGLSVGNEVTRAHLELEERSRLTKLFIVATSTLTIKRRLGPEASPGELGADRLRSRRIAHVANQCLTAWGGKYGSPGDIAREAAQVRWGRWWADHEVWIHRRIVYIATWATYSEEERWAKSAVVRLNNEHEWLHYAMRN